MDRYLSLARTLELIRKLETDLYENAVIPVALAHRYTAISAVPGGQVLDILSKDLFNKKYFPKNKRYIFTIEPLYFKRDQLGFILIEENLKEFHFYESLRTQLSVAIKDALLFQEKEKLLLNLKNHTEKLQIAMEKLSLSNKELEQFSYIASHDLLEPLRKISVFAGRIKNECSIT